MNEKLHKTMIWGVVVSEASHLFCCVFPTLFSLLSLLAGMGLVATMPGFMVEFHAFMHEWELPVIIASGVVIALSWLILWASRRAGCCHHTGCEHGSCMPVKRRANIILMVASTLFVFNVAVYTFVHRSGVVEIVTESAAQGAQREDGGLGTDGVGQGRGGADNLDDIDDPVRDRGHNH